MVIADLYSTTYSERRPNATKPRSWKYWFKSVLRDLLCREFRCVSISVHWDNQTA